MKVLHVIDRLKAGGAERMFVTATSLLRNTDIQVAAMVFNSGFPLDDELPKGLTLHVLNRSNKFSFSTLYKAHKIFRQYDIIHAHLRHVHAYARLAQLLFGGKYTLILHDHTPMYNELPIRLKGVLKPKYYIGVDEEQKRLAKEVLGLNDSKMFLLENVVVPTSSFPTKVNSDKAIMVSNIRRPKKIHFAIEVISKMDLALDVYGIKVEQDYYEEVTQLADDNPNVNIIEGVTGFSNVYSQYSIAMHTSVDETGPLVLQEYLAAGLPFIAYNFGSVARAVSSELPELFMDNLDADKWIERIQHILSTEGLPERMKQAFDKHFSTDKYISDCLSIYKAITS